MALISCYECGKEMSEMAANCPHCGAPRQEPVIADDGTKAWFDAQGRKIFYKIPDNSEIWFDVNEKVTKFKLPSGEEYNVIYNSEGGLDHIIDIEGAQMWFDSNWRIIRYIMPSGDEFWPDETRRNVCIKLLNGTKLWAGSESEKMINNIDDISKKLIPIRSYLIIEEPVKEEEPIKQEEPVKAENPIKTNTREKDSPLKNFFRKIFS